MAGEAETLLDVFVAVGVKEQGETVDQYVERVKKTFSTLGKAGPPALEKSIESIREEFDRLLASATLTSKQIDRMSFLATKLDDAAVAAAALRKNLIPGNAQINALSNNAYQLGQAFEDAAIGFQLNGLSGAFRGASNNITFLINNLSQSGALTGILGAKAAALVPLYAGVGAALAFIVLPPLIEWLETLNDIDAKSKDISDLIAREFANARFEVSLQIDQQSAINAVRDAENAAEAIRLVIEQAQASDKLTIQLSAELSNLSKRQVIDDLGKTFDDLQAAIAKRMEEASRVLVQLPVQIGDPGLPDIQPNPKEIQGVENLDSALNVLRVSLKQVFDQSRQGIVDQGSTESARDSIAFIAENMEQLKDSGFLTEETFKAIEATLKAARGELEKIAEDASRIVSINENLNRLLDEAKSKGEALSTEYEFQRAVNEGRLTDEDRILFALQQQTAEIDKQNDKIREQFGDNPIAQRIIAQEELNLQQRQEIDLTKEIRDINETIADESERAAKEANDALKARQRTERRIQEEQERGNERVANAQESLNDEIAQQARSAQEKLIQDRIDALQKLDKAPQTSALGSERSVAFADDVKPEIDRLQDLLKQQRDLQKLNDDRDRIRDLEQRIVDDRQDAAERIQGLRDDAMEARQEEIDATKKSAEEMEKLRDQLEQLNQALQNVQQGGDIGIPQLDAEGERNGPLFAPEMDANDMVNAQAQANAAALQDIDFKSSSLETLTAQTNRLLSSLNDNVSNLDLEARFA